MIKNLALLLSIQTAYQATVTDVNGESIEIEDSFFPIYEINQANFDETWSTTDDRVMGGQSYSYVNYDSNGFGLFNGTANDDGGGFRNVKMRGDYLFDLS